MSKRGNSYFPLFVDMSGKTVVFAGGGKVAVRRIQAFLSVLGETSDHVSENRLHVVVAAPAADEKVEEYSQKGLLLWKKRKFLTEDVDKADFVIAATDDRELNQQIVKLCRNMGIPVNDAGEKENCDFYFPGIAVQGDLVAGVTASGKDHKKTRQVTEAVRRLLKEEGE